MSDEEATQQASNWFESFAGALISHDISGILGLFLEDCYWRDLLAFTWNIKTLEGKAAIAAMLEAQLRGVGATDLRLSGSPIDTGTSTEAWFTFETSVARCDGIVRLRDGRCRTILTITRELKGFEEKTGARRELGLKHKADPNRETWSEARRREEAELGRTEQPYCVIIGGGQGGIALGARLKQLNVPTIIIEKNARAGDSWRNRYKSLVLHDPVWYDHLPYIPFPEHWPVFTPKDKMGDWLEMYVKVMELNYWSAAECLRAAYDPNEKIWNVEVDHTGERVTLRPRQLVFATGAYGPPRNIDLPGLEDYNGELIHSSQYSDGARFAKRQCVVIGAASSGHDVCVDLWESGAAVTMIQRSPTTVVKSETLRDLGFENFSQRAIDRGVTTEKADMLMASMPFALLPEAHKKLYDAIRARDADFYERLEASGFAIDFGPDDSGLSLKALRTGSGYYIDVGASDLIINGDIRVKSGVAINRLTKHGILFEDGEEIRADAIISCIGYQSMHEAVAAIVSREVADAIGPCWGLGSGTKGDPGPWQGELRNMWKPTAQEALWFQGGNLALTRFYSKILALQIKARMENLPTRVYPCPVAQ